MRHTRSGEGVRGLSVGEVLLFCACAERVVQYIPENGSLDGDFCLHREAFVTALHVSCFAPGFRYLQLLWGLITDNLSFLCGVVNRINIVDDETPPKESCAYCLARFAMPCSMTEYQMREANAFPSI